MPNAPLTPWQVLTSEPAFQAPPWIEVSRQQIRLPDGRTINDYHQIALADYVIVVAQTSDERVVLERMYKHGIGRVCLMLPAGAIDKGEAPGDAAQRELLEETGYAAGDWQFLGSFVCHANYGCGTAHVFHARNARPVAEPDSGDLEEIEIVLLDPLEVATAIHGGEMRSLGVVAAALLALGSSWHPTASHVKDRGEARAQ
jgi:ADP-ribose pyrophosphatase